MSGLSVAVRTQAIQSLEIIVEQDNYIIEGARRPFPRTASNATLQEWTEYLLQAFRKIERAVVKAGTIDFSQDEALRNDVAKPTEELMTWGRRAYRQFFEDQNAQAILTRMIEFHEKRGDQAAPFFSLREIPFPWELLYSIGEDEVPDGEDPVSFFWGMRYPVSRNLTDLPFELHVPEQSSESNMLFGLHHKLRHAHHDEWPRLRELVTAGGRGRVYILGGEVGFLITEERKCEGKDLLKYLYKASHNVVHFACHCRPGEGQDVLLLSLIQDASYISDEGVAGDVPVIKLGTFTFLDASGKFEKQQPLVFLNACQTTGDTDPVSLEFNLPEKFVNKGAAAVIATVCPVPDLFAAAFAREFYHRFLGEGVEIGEALRVTRLHFWEKYNNPLGLAYGLYSSPYYRVSPNFRLASQLPEGERETGEVLV